MAVAGSVIVLVLFAVSLLAPWLAPYDPNAIDLKNVLAAALRRRTPSGRIRSGGMCSPG